MNAATARYWRQVHTIESMTGTTSAIARRAVATLREEFGLTSAHAVRHDKASVESVVTELEKEAKRPYADLDDFIDAFESWEYEYDYYDVETSADY